MNLPTEPYSEQLARWPPEGRHILAHHDAETIVVYQAYRPEIGRFAIEHGRFGGAFSYTRMSWIKPNFLWMMYRSGWGTKAGQEITLGLRLRRSFFDRILAHAVASTLEQSTFDNREDWKAALAGSEVRLQWDPDHDPAGGRVARRAIQLGLRGATLAAFGKDELLDVIDMSAFVAEQRAKTARSHWSALRTPMETVYRPDDQAIADHLKLD